MVLPVFLGATAPTGGPPAVFFEWLYYFVKVSPPCSWCRGVHRGGCGATWRSASNGADLCTSTSAARLIASAGVLDAVWNPPRRFQDAKLTQIAYFTVRGFHPPCMVLPVFLGATAPTGGPPAVLF